MGILDRFKRVVRSNINDMISKAEDPEKMLNQLIMEMNEQLSESKKSVAHAIADEKKLERQLSEHKKNSDKWEQNAMLAVRSGKEDLAKKALLRKEEYDQYVTSFIEQYEQQHKSVELLKDSLRQLQQKIEEASRKKTLLIARAKRAEAQKRIHTTISLSSNTSAFDAFQRMADKVEQKEAEAEASDDLAQLESADNSLEKEIEGLEENKSVDELLNNLKKKMDKERQ